MATETLPKLDAKGRTIVTCPICDGRGELEKTGAVDPETGYPDTVTCERCDGAGTVLDPDKLCERCEADEYSVVMRDGELLCENCYESLIDAAGDEAFQSAYEDGEL